MLLTIFVNYILAETLARGHKKVYICTLDTFLPDTRSMEALTLFELNARVRALIEGGTETSYWVQGELMEGREGSCCHL